MRSKPAPPYVAYTVPPVEVALGARPFELLGGAATARVSARLFDFGALSVVFAFDLGGTLDALPAFAQALARSDLGREAARVRDTLASELRSALRRPAARTIWWT